MISRTLRRAAWIVCRNVKGCAGGGTVGGIKGEEFLKTVSSSGYDNDLEMTNDQG